MKRSITIAAAATALLFAAGPAFAELVDRVAAVVNGDVIALSEVEQRAAPELQALERQVDPKKRAELHKKVMDAALEQLISEKLMEKEMDDLGITVTDQEVELGIEDVRKQNNNMDEATFEQALRQEGMTLEGYKDFMRKHLRQLKLVNLKVRSKVKVSDKDLQQAYETWARMQDDAEVHARHILVKVAPDAPQAEVEKAHQKAEAIAQEARKPGVDFAALAKQKSEGPSKEDGGDLGFFKRGLMLPEVDKVAFSLPVGGVSDPVRSRFGWHVIKVEERRAAEVKSFDEMKPQLQEKLTRDQIEKYTEQYVKELRRNATVEVKI